MKGRSPLGTLAASPTMVGAVTTLIVIVAVFLAYNANNGLPFVPVYRVSVEIPNGARLTNNNEVRIGGHRVGVVESIDAVQSPEATATAQASGANAGAGETGGVVAKLNLKLDKSVEPIPRDSVFRVRYRSTFGLKYLDIVRGTGDSAPEGYVFNGLDDPSKPGKTTCLLPNNPNFASQQTAQNGCFEPQTEFDEIADTFDTKTRTAVRTNLTNFGAAFAGRGTSLNDAISSLAPLFRGLRPVTRVLVQRDTQLRRFFPALARVAEQIAPVAAQQADLFTKGAIAFAAISSDPQALEETISESALTLETGIDVLPRQTPFLRDLATLGRVLRPGVTDLRATLPILNQALEVGTPALAKLPPTNRRLEDVFREVDELVSQPTTRTTLQRLGETFDVAKPLAEWVVPAQTVCNYWNYFFNFIANGLSDRDQVGYSFRQSLALFPAGVDAPVDMFAGAQANGKMAGATGVFKPYEVPILNAHPYAPAGERNADCQTGQSGYALGALPLPGQPPESPVSLSSDLPGSRGPTTLFYNDNRRREFVDTRNPNRAPETWKKVGP
jgi:ABC-type transporter Mla subunit MlaD